MFSVKIKKDVIPDAQVTHQFADPVQHNVNDLFADGVVSTGVVVGSIFLPSDQLLRVEQLAVDSRANFI